jgi:hypothetical protein
MKYYVYVYLNPLKPGKYEYGDISFDFEPFYVGKGFGKRHLYHINKVKNKNKFKTSVKFDIITDIVFSKLDPLIIKLRENLTEDESLTLEKDTILKIGRMDLSRGPLSNLNNGGQKPQDGYKHSEETKKKIRQSYNYTYPFWKIISPDGKVYENSSLIDICRDHNLEYRKMRKFANRGKMKIHKNNPKIETLNCEGWEVLNMNEKKKKPKMTLKYLLIDPEGKEFPIYTHESATEKAKNLNLNFRILKLYRNRGKIQIRNIKKCINETSMNCQNWQFIDVVNNENKYYVSDRRKIAWKIISPKGEVFFEKNLLKFCKENSLSYRTFNTFKNLGIINLSIRKNYGREIINTIGWQCEDIKNVVPTIF